MTEQKYLYPYDPTGAAASNRITNEPHTITELNGDNFRIVVPDKTPFYANNLVVVHRESGLLLDKGVHYELGHIYRDLSLHLKQSVYGTINIIDSTLSGNLVISYNTVGGQFVSATREMTLTAAQMLMNPKYTTLEDIIDMPAELPPFAHGLQAMNEIVGMDAVVEVLQTIVTVISGNPSIEHQHEIESVRNLAKELRNRAASNRAHKTALVQGTRVLNHTGSIAITFPRFEIATRIRATISLLMENHSCTLKVEGTIGGKDVAAYEVDWIRGAANLEGTLAIPNVSFSYDVSKNPTIYVGEGMTFGDCFVSIDSLTIDSASPELYIDGYGCSPSAIMVGTSRHVEYGVRVPSNDNP